MPRGKKGVSGRKRESDGQKRLTNTREQATARGASRREQGLKNNQDPMEEQEVNHESTFEVDGTVLSPRLLEDGELPEITSIFLRSFIDHVASGINISPSLEFELKKNHSGGEIARAAKEGISRWHNPGKERG